MAQRRWALRQLLLVLTVLPCCTSLQVSIPQEEYEIARGGEITLTCVFVAARPELTMFVIKWEALPDNDGYPAITVASIFKDNDPDIAPDYEGRATMEVDLDQRRSSLTLTETTLEDSRHYQCSVIIPNDDKGNTPRYQAATTSLLVLVAPSTPICSIQGKAEYYQDIKLTCLSEEGSPAPAYEWKSYNVENVPRQLPPKTVQEDGVLSLFNITRETSGFFTCSSTNRVGSASCTFTLAVMPRESHSASLGSVIVSSLAESACSPCASMGFIQELEFPPTAQNQVFSVADDS